MLQLLDFTSIVEIKDGRFSLLGSILDAHFCYSSLLVSSPFPNQRSRIASYRIRSAGTPKEVLEIAAKQGERFEHPYITDVLSDYSPLPIAEVESNDLLDVANRLQHVAHYGYTIVSTRHPHMQIGLPVRASIINSDWISVHLLTLVRVLSTLPNGQKVDVGILCCKDNAPKALRIACGNDPGIVYYLPEHGQGFSRFIH